MACHRGRHRHGVFQIHLLSRLQARHGAHPRGLFEPQGRGRGVALPGVGDRAFGYRRAWQYRGCRHCGFHRWSGRYVLDDCGRDHGYVAQVRRMHVGRQIPQRVSGRYGVGRPDVLPEQGLGGEEHGRAGKIPGGVLCDLLYCRRARRWQHVPGEPVLPTVRQRHGG